MAQVDLAYRELCSRILEKGFVYKDKSRDAVPMLQIPNYQLGIPITSDFPLLTTKRIYWKAVAHELIWMLSGSEKIDYLICNNVNIWNKDAENFSGGTYVGRIYGAQWRKWTVDQNAYIDQIQNLFHYFRTDPFNRRHIVTAWQPAELLNMALPPCHWSFEIIPMDENDHPSFMLKWHQRSVDTFLGLPFDIASYAFLGKIIEAETGSKFAMLVGDLSNVHFYGPHLHAVNIQMMRGDLHRNGPDFKLENYTSLDKLTIDNFNIFNYNPQAAIKAEMISKSYKFII